MKALVQAQLARLLKLGRCGKLSSCKQAAGPNAQQANFVIQADAPEALSGGVMDDARVRRMGGQCQVARYRAKVIEPQFDANSARHIAFAQQV